MFFYSCEHGSSNTPDECFPRSSPVMLENWYEVPAGDSSLYPGLSDEDIAALQPGTNDRVG